MRVLYKSVGCLIFTGGNIWGGAGGDLIQIEVDPSGAAISLKRHVSHSGKKLRTR